MNGQREGGGAAVELHVRDRWAAAPLRLMEAGCGLSPAARLALVYLLGLGQRPGWKISARHVVKMLGFGNARWPRVRQELEAAGYLHASRAQDPAGRWVWTYHIYDRPQAGSTVPAVSGDGGTGDGVSGDIQEKTLHKKTLLKEAEAPRARARVVPPPEAAGAATSGEKKQRGPRRRYGVTCWNEADLAWVEDLTGEAGAEAVRAAASTIRGLGEDPLPSAVEKRLREDAAERVCKEAEQAAVRAEEEKRCRKQAEAQAREARRNDPATQAAAERTLAAIRVRLR